MTSLNNLLFICVIGLISVTTTKADNCTDFHPNGPKITPCRSEFILQKGQNISFTCRGKTKVEFKQQETPEEMIINTPRTVNNIIPDSDYPFETILTIDNVDEHHIGFYACFDDVDTNYILNNLVEEPKNTEHASFIYIYVDGTDSLIAPMREVVVPRNCSKVVIECRPTTPDVDVTLKLNSQQEKQDLKYYKKIGFVMNSCGKSGFNCTGLRPGYIPTSKSIRNIKKPPKPRVTGGSDKFLEGETFTINCSVPYNHKQIINFEWLYPPGVTEDSIEVKNNGTFIEGSRVYKNIIIKNATKKHGGTYTCRLWNTCGVEKAKFTKKFLDEPFLELNDISEGKLKEIENRSVNILIEISAYPPVERFHFLKNGKYLPSNDLKYHVSTLTNGDPNLMIKDLTLNDIANYTLVANNTYLNKTYNVELWVSAKPIVKMVNNKIIKRLVNTEMNFVCKVDGYPLPDVTWIFSDGQDNHKLPSTSFEQESLYKKTEHLKINVQETGIVKCEAINGMGNHSDFSELFVYEINNGFGILDLQESWYSENNSVEKKCYASIYDYDDVDWLGSDGIMLNGLVEYYNSTFSHVAILKFDPISLEQAGTYTCQATKKNSTESVTENITITVADIKPPIIQEPTLDVEEAVTEERLVELYCKAEGVPRPTIEWYKNGELISDNPEYNIITKYINNTIVNSTIEIEKMFEQDAGKYECVVTNNIGPDLRRTYFLALKAEKSFAPYVIAAVIIIIILIGIILYLYTWKLKKQRQLKKAGLANFLDGNKKSFNPKLGIDEQADLLPYDKKFEFPREKLELGEQLGAGAFGVVYKAQARGIINAEVTTPVAVKMVKRTADNMYIKALASELKIMVHLGKHVNILNLLGACTTNIAKRELIVIVEYCKYGNIHNYMQKHREVFIDQLTDNADKNFGKINKGFLNSVGSTGTHSDYFSSGNTKDTDHSLLDSGNTNRSCRKVSEGYVQQGWQTRYEGDYNYEFHQPRPLTSGHLLGWAFQIARGMEYLANRRVLHGDLAARNVLLAEDNVVKICDFGLARSMYNNEEYQKKENGPLPVKWLAIECMVDRIFSTQSDVWSYGIVLWEMFSLARTPYPNISPTDLLRWLSCGNRLEKPPFADDRLYDVMLRCWHQKPTMRPSFTELQEILGNFLEDNERNRYLDLNAPYNEMNANQMQGEDYLAMVCAPDYNNIVTPNYVNMTQSFFPSTPSARNPEGYLPMSPTSGQTYTTHDTKFDFDSKKLNPRESEVSNVGSAVTPLLDLNNLPARSGSESDQENHISVFPDKCAVTDRKSDEVFEMKLANAKNAQDNSAVTNPTYYTIDVENEKKPKEITNSYVNFPNGSIQLK